MARQSDQPIEQPEPDNESADVALARLNERQAKFAVGFVNEGNASKAARDAGYSPKIASQIATKLQRHPQVSVAIQALRREMAEGKSVSVDAVVNRLRAHALTDVTSLLAKRKRFLYDSSGNAVTDPDTGEHKFQVIWVYRDPDELSADQRAIISAVSLNTRTMRDGSIRQTITYKTQDQSRALDGLSRVLGMNVETHRHQHSGSVEHQVSAMFSFVASNRQASETTARIGHDAPGTPGRRRQPLTIEHK